MRPHSRSTYFASRGLARVGPQNRRAKAFIHPSIHLGQRDYFLLYREKFRLLTGAESAQRFLMRVIAWARALL
jgi:hypothetical protein